MRGEEPGDAGEDERCLLGTLRPRVVLADGGLEHLVPVELGVFGEQRVAERGDELGAGRRRRGGTRAAIVPGAVDVALRLPARGEVGEVAGRARRAGAPRAR